jgi:hypothetical protein
MPVWRNGRRKALKMPFPTGVPVRVRPQVPLFLVANSIYYGIFKP